MRLSDHLWRYIGPAPYQGMTHSVIWHDTETNEIITHCIQSSWLGTLAEFRKNFQQLK